MVELCNQRRILGQLAFSDADAVLEAHQVCLQLCHGLALLLPCCLSQLQTA